MSTLVFLKTTCQIALIISNCSYIATCGLKSQRACRALTVLCTNALCSITATACQACPCPMQEQGSHNPGTLLQQLQAAQGSPRQHALLMRMLQESMLSAAAREGPLAARVLPRVLCSILPSLTCRSQ